MDENWLTCRFDQLTSVVLENFYCFQYKQTISKVSKTVSGQKSVVCRQP
jgi:hypothetical protein